MPLATRLVPTRTSRRPSAKASRTRSAAPLRSATSRSSRPTRRPGSASRTSSLDALRAAAEVADPRRPAGRTARRQGRRRAAVVAAQRACRPGGRRAGARTRGSAWTWPQSRHSTTEAVPRRLITRIARSPAGNGRARPSAPPAAGQQPAVAGGQLGAEVDDLDRGRRPGRPRRQSRRGGSRPPGAPDALDRRRRAAEDDGGAGQPARGRAPRRGPGAAASGRSCRRRRAPRRRRSGRRRRAAPGQRRPRPDDDVATSPARIRRHSSARSPSPRPGVEERDLRVEIGPQPVDERHGERDLRHEHERRAAGRRDRPRWPRRRRRSCRRR